MAKPEGKEWKIDRTFGGEGMEYLSRTVDIVDRGAGTRTPCPRNKVGPQGQGSDWTGWVGRAGQASESKTAAPSATHGFQVQLLDGKINKLMGSS